MDDVSRIIALLALYEPISTHYSRYPNRRRAVCGCSRNGCVVRPLVPREVNREHKKRFVRIQLLTIVVAAIFVDNREICIFRPEFLSKTYAEFEKSIENLILRIASYQYRRR